MLITVLHESVYTDVCIMNEVELLIQICGLHKESKGRGKGALWSISLWLAWRSSWLLCLFLPLVVQ